MWPANMEAVTTLNRRLPVPSGWEATIGLVAAPGHIQQDCRSRM